jgi:hypothetical protein
VSPCYFYLYYKCAAAANSISSNSDKYLIGDTIMFGWLKKLFSAGGDSHTLEEMAPAKPVVEPAVVAPTKKARTKVKPKAKMIKCKHCRKSVTLKEYKRRHGPNCDSY